MNIIQYVKRNKASFSERPLNEVDSLVFAEVAYFNFSRAESREPSKTLGELSENIDSLVAGTLSILRKNNIRLLKAIHDSPRYAPVKVGYFRVRNSNQKDERFAAVTFRLAEGVYHIAYRGTGVSLIGWRENLKMALMSVIPTQRIALKYLVEVASKVSGVLTVGGLSKGGNLSVFSSTFAPSEVQSRIASVFDHDGPGFKESIFGDPCYLQIADRVHKTVPHDSIVGMLLAASQVYDVVDSSGVSISQHNPFTWIVGDLDKFKKLPETTRASKATDTAVTSWLANMNERTRRKFVYAVFAIVEGSGATEVGDFFHRPLHKIRLMRKTYDGLSAADKELISHGGKQLLTLWFGEIFARARKKQNK